MPIFERSAISRSSTPTASRIWRSSGPVNSVRGPISRHRRARRERRRISVFAAARVDRRGVARRRDRHRHAVGKQLAVVFLALRRVHQRRVREVEPAVHGLEARRIVEAPTPRSTRRRRCRGSGGSRAGCPRSSRSAAPRAARSASRDGSTSLVVSRSRRCRSRRGPPAARARRARSTSRSASRGARSAAAGGAASTPTPPRRTRGGRDSESACRAGGAPPTATARPSSMSDFERAELITRCGENPRIASRRRSTSSARRGDRGEIDVERARRAALVLVAGGAGCAADARARRGARAT